MPNEIEIKFQVKDFKAVLAELRRCKAKFLGQVHENDQFFDSTSGELMSADRGLRLRLTRTGKPACGVAPLLTYKGPRRLGSRLKIRQEIQFHVDDARATAAMLKALGYLPSLVVRKRRSTYTLGRCSVLLDELRGIGRFVEVEGPSQRLVEAACRNLGLVGATVTKSYARLTAEAKHK